MALLVVSIGSTRVRRRQGGRAVQRPRPGPAALLQRPRVLARARRSSSAFVVGLAARGADRRRDLGARHGRDEAAAERARSRRALARAFAHTLIPIAAGYLVAHYFSLLAYNGQDLWRLANDPLGNGSDYFGGADATIDYGVVSATGIWYVQVGALVVGHVAALVLAHDRALELYGSARQATRSQVVMLAADGRVHLPRPVAAVGGAERMTPLAHAGHWAAQLLYLAPVLAMVGAILWAKIRGARAATSETSAENLH